mgnify:CR=1 FL=1
MHDVLLLTVDSLRADHVGAYGYDRDTTPNIDHLAERGAVFNNTFANATFTRASFPAILTSSYPLMYGGYERVSPDRTIISEVLDQAGYATAGFHSNLFMSKEFGYGRGFDAFYDSRPDPSYGARLKQFVKDRLDPDGWLYQRLASGVNRAERNVGVNFGSFYTEAEELTDLAVDWIHETEASGPRFIWAHYMDPHHPYVPPDQFQRQFRDELISRRESLQLRRKMMEEPEAISPNERQKLIDLYDAEIRYTDEQIGRLVGTATDAWGERPTVIVTADHGEEFGEHGQYSHNRTFFDEVLKVPLVVDGWGGDSEYDDLVASMDIPATIAAAATDEIPDNYFGHDLRTLLSDGEWDRSHVISEVDSDDTLGEFSVRTDSWKYIQKPDVESIYDLETDLSETENLIDKESGRVQEFQTVVESHEEDIRRTESDLDSVEMDDATEQRLRNLGYRE